MPHNTPTKILLLLHELRPGGAPKVIIDALSCRSSELDIRTISLTGGQWEQRCSKLGPLLIYWPKPVASIIKKYPSLIAKHVRRLMWKIGIRHWWKPDVVYINSVWSLRLAALIDLPEGVPVILHVHETGNLLSCKAHQFSGILRNLPSKYIAVTDNVRRQLIDLYGIPESKISVIHNYVDDQKLLQQQAQPNPNGVFTVGGAGYLNWYKGGILWLQMARELIRISDQPVRFMWVGVTDDAEGEVFRQIARKMDIESYVEFIPPQADPTSFFASFDIVAVSSWEESFSLVAAENMMLGKPVVCFAGSGGTPEVVGDAGVVIDEFSPRLMAEAILELAQSPERRRAMGIAAQERAIKLFSAEQQISKICDVIKQAACPAEYK